MSDARSALENISKAFRLIWQAHPSSTVGMGLVTLISASLPAAQAWAGKLIVDGVVTHISKVGGAGASVDVMSVLQPVLPYLGVEFALVTIGAVLSQGRTLLEHILHARLSHNINSAIIRKSLALDLQFFEDAEFYDKLQNARQRSRLARAQHFERQLSGCAERHHVALVHVVLLAFNPLIALLLFGATMPSFIAQTQVQRVELSAADLARARIAQDELPGTCCSPSTTASKRSSCLVWASRCSKRYDDMFWKFFEEMSTARRRSLDQPCLGHAQPVATTAPMPGCSTRSWPTITLGTT